MKGKQLRKAVLLGMAMSMAVWTTGMAAADVGQITEPDKTVTDETITVSYDGEDISQGAVHFTEGSGDLDVSLIATGPGADAINISSTGYGIRVENKYNDDGVAVGEYDGEIILDSQGGGNSITFGKGSGISANSGAAISLNAASVNMITNGDGGEDQDGINVGAANTGKISLTGANNVIRVAGQNSDGIYTETGSKSDETMTATTGNNTITAGNNAIDHRGSGTVELKAVNGGNILTAGEGDGIRVDGSGSVSLIASENIINAGDNGIQVNGGGKVSIIGMSNSIVGNNAGIDATNGEIIIADDKSENITSGSIINISKKTEDVGYGIYVHGESQIDGNAFISIKADEVNISSDGKSGDAWPTVAGVYLKENSGIVNVNAGVGGLTIKGTATIFEDANVASIYGMAIHDFNEAHFSSLGDVLISSEARENNANAIGIDLESQNRGNTLMLSGDNVTIQAISDKGATFGIDSEISDKATKIYENSISISAQNNILINAKASDVATTAEVSSTGITSAGTDVSLISSNGSVSINALGNEYSTGIWVAKKEINSEIRQGSVMLDSAQNNLFTSSGSAIQAVTANSMAEVTAKHGYNQIQTAGTSLYTNLGGAITLNAKEGYNFIQTDGLAAYATNGGQIKLNAEYNQIEAETSGLYAWYDNSYISLDGEKGNTITATGEEGTTIWSYGTNANISVTAAEGDNTIASAYRGIVAQSDSTVNLTAEAGSNNITATGASGYAAYASDAGTVSVTAAEGDNTLQSAYRGIYAGSSSTVNLTAEAGSNSVTADTNYAIFANSASAGLDAKIDNTVTGSTYGLIAQKQGKITVDAGGSNTIKATGASGTAVYVSDTSDVSVTAETGNNVIQSGTVQTAGEGGSNYNVGSSYGVYAYSGGDVTLNAGNQNAVYGAVYARGMGSDNTATRVTIAGLVDESGTAAASAANYIGSAAAIANAGDLNTDESFAGKSVISAIYAEDGAQITVNGEQNVIRTYADNTNENQLERTVWAYNGAEIDIDGTTLISTDRYETSPNSLDIAIAAGSAVGLTEEAVNAPVTDPSVVNLTYGSYTDADGNFVSSSITGDILAAYTGQVNIAPKDTDADAKINITGNLLAGNNGVLKVDLGNGGVLTGRADDYGDAGVIDNSGHGTEFFDPAFSSAIYKGGVINLTMGENSRWNVTGQSWITRINTESAALADEVMAAEDPVEAMSHMATIDLVEANTDRNTSAHALTIYEMTGDAAFTMNLDANRDVSDMLYMKTANGDYIINVVDAVTLNDMYAGGFDGLRFATVGENSNVSFRAVTVDDGVFDVEYEVGTDAYAGNDENHAYNGGTAVSEEKPGSGLVDGFFDSTQKPGETQNQMRMAAVPAAANDGIMLLDDTAAADSTDTAANGSVEETTNFKLIGVKSTELSDAGKTVVAMSRVNYSNAVYMDRLNKRMGEARYLDGDEGLWVRMRHDRIGKSDAFRSMNTMMELGYDRKVGDREDGEHRQGMAIDYMRGTADYKNVAGEGDVRRGGVWFYDTWLGDKGHYTDYVLKFGRLSNDFEVYARSTGEKITGDYSNFVYSASAEYGRKKDLGSNWYIEPQAQIQYAHVTDADYTTSQGTAVQLDAIDSLIGRVGFRLGKDLGDKSTFYIKADILHEFLGDQDIEARDATGFLDTTYENEGTWYDIGLGFSHQFSKGTYMFLDMEKSIGNDNEDTYQFNFGMNWKV